MLLLHCGVRLHRVVMDPVLPRLPLDRQKWPLVGNIAVISTCISGFRRGNAKECKFLVLLIQLIEAVSWYGLL